MKLELFKMDSCPYCQRVLREIRTSGRSDVVLFDTDSDPSARARLVREGGMDQVPCLFIDGTPLYESLDIIEWLRSHPRR